MEIRIGYQVTTPNAHTGTVVDADSQDGVRRCAVRRGNAITWHWEVELDLPGATAAKNSREKAAANIRDAHESWERSDTDGALTQWSSGVMSSVYRLQAEIDLSGGRAMFPALFDLEGNMIAAKRVRCRNPYGHGNDAYRYRWAFLASDDPNAPVVRWESESEARNPATRKRNNEKKGFRVGQVMAAAQADLAGGASVLSVHAYAKRTDGGFSRNAVVVHSGDDLAKYITW